MKAGPRIATAVAVGYALGRSRKAKLAFAVGGYLAGKRLGGGSQALLHKAGEAVTSSPELRQLGESLRGRLFDVARSAATSAATHRIEALTDSLTRAAGGSGSSEGERDQDQDDQERGRVQRKRGRDRGEEQDAGDQDQDDQGQEEQDELEEQVPAPRRRPAAPARPRKPATSRSSGARTSGGGSTRTRRGA
ncbi:hypothetical protein [Saccharopolyspora sp. CA-218241]|uniref:hypothetical protein n=1 Tax=Saccharopolyspora sp. CA-218241 TaxID=3240027 RepID=UPI003D997619